jgi:long-chain acyl-CoA synthetase
MRPITPNASSIGDMFRRRARATPSLPAIYEKRGEKRGSTWEKTTWGEFYDRSRRAARGLAALGVGKGDRVAVLGPTRSPWAVADMAAQLLTAVSFGIYPQQTPQQIRYLLEHSEAKAVYVDGENELRSVIAAAEGLESVRAIIPWDAALTAAFRGRDARIVSPEVLHGDPIDEAEIDHRLAAALPDDTALLVYTSGTTGPPKGAMVSHANVLSHLEVMATMHEFSEGDLSLNFLPMAHAAERILGFFGRINVGMATAYARSMATVLEDVSEVAPTMFGAVPRIFEKAYAKVYAELERKPKAVQALFAWAVSVGKRAALLEREGRPVPHGLRLSRMLADRIVFRRVRAAFGGRVRLFITGAAPIALPILEFFWAAGLPIYEVYGMTEATVATHGNRPGAVRLGTVGRVIAPMEAKIAGDGEILVRGPWVFQGYLKNPEATRELLEGGWLHTGDIGAIDGDGYLRITDRKKHLIITAGGKNLAPANIENAIKNQDPLVSQVYAHGDRRPYVVAIIAPSPLETLAWGEERGILDASQVKALAAELTGNPTARSASLNAAMAKVVAAGAFGQRICEAVRRGNETLAHVEQVRRVAVLDRDFSADRGELTPTMKLKRKAVAEMHAELIDAVYEGGGLEV